MDFDQGKPYKVICIDEMFAKSTNKSGNTYVCGAIDAATDEVLALHAADTRDSEIAHKTLDRIIERIGKENLKDTILHSDHGLIYFDREFSRRCKELGIIQSMERVGISTDNRPIEVFWKEFRLRYLWKLHWRKRSCKKLDAKCQEWMYNHNNRKQKKLNRLTPVQFREAL